MKNEVERIEYLRIKKIPKERIFKELYDAEQKIKELKKENEILCEEVSTLDTRSQIYSEDITKLKDDCKQLKKRLVK